MLFYIIVSIILFLLHTFLTLTTKINIYPELVFYPFLIQKGMLLYRDFTIQHGYFLQILLTPFSLDRSLTAMKGLYVGLQMVNLFLVLRVLKKTTNKKGFALGGFLFVILNYYLSDSNLWDELIVGSIYLIVYFLLIQNIQINKAKLLLIGLLIGFASFIKPTYIVMIIPVVIYSRSLMPVITLSATWVFSLLYFLCNKTIDTFFNFYIYYNQHYAFGSRKIFSMPHILTEKSFIFYTTILLIISLFLFMKQKIKFKNDLIILFVIFSLLLFFPGYSKFNLVPFGIFLSIFVGKVLGNLKNKKYVYLYIVVLIFYGIFISHKTVQLYKYFKTNRLPFLENSKTARIVNKIKNFSIGSKKIYVLGNNVELYYFLDKVPPVWYTIIWQVSLSYYPDIEQRIISDIKKGDVDYVIIPKPYDSNYVGLKKLQTFIEKSYSKKYENADFNLLRKIK